MKLTVHSTRGFDAAGVKKALYIPVHLGMCAGILVVVGILMMRHHSTPVPVRDPIW